MNVVSSVKAMALASTTFFAQPDERSNQFDTAISTKQAHFSASLAQARLPVGWRTKSDLAISPIVTPAITKVHDRKTKTLHTLLLIGTLATGALGYLRYATGSAPLDERKKFVWSNLGSRLFAGQPFIKGDYTAMHNWVVIHASNLLVGVAALTSSKASFASVVSMSAPAIFLAGTLGCLKITARHGSMDTHPLLLGCKSLSYAALGIFVAAKFNLLDAALHLKPETMSTLAIIMALTARTLGCVGFTWKYIKSAVEKSKEFPQLANMTLWTAATAFSAAAVSNPTSQAAWIPIGYFLQNFIILSTGIVSYAIWNSRKRR